ncbi:transposable element Tcb2 transposase [Trichonephila clavipes]|nr:transposable element Tcb2 transposase [Trichonephila clavipes]
MAYRYSSEYPGLFRRPWHSLEALICKVKREPNSSRSSESHWSVTKCDFQDLNRFLETESAGRRPGQGRRQATTPNKDHYLVLTARRTRNMNAILLQQHLRSVTGTTVSTQTVQNRFHGVGL